MTPDLPKLPLEWNNELKSTIYVRLERRAHATPALETVDRFRTRWPELIRGCFIVHAGDPDRDIAQAALRLRPPLGELNESFFPTVRGLVRSMCYGCKLQVPSSPILSDRLPGQRLHAKSAFGHCSGNPAISGRHRCAEAHGGVFEGYTPRHPVHLTKAEAKLVVDICRRLALGDQQIDRELGRLLAMLAPRGSGGYFSRCKPTLPRICRRSTRFTS